ncbi:MAG TPA: hypothetical protein VGS41_07680, partial [Chthonomonadales bacterium]|nr:hypothetical protein [Chthonomonadales bacterium]
HEALRKQVPNLDYVDSLGLSGEDQSSIVGLVKSSLGNVLRLVRPIVVMDEGQKAFSQLAYQTLYGFNPRFVIELSATPRDGNGRWANWLCNITGEELLREEMIKMPMEVRVKGETDWRDCLREAWQKTEELRQEAERYRADSQTYIRPILLVQVERVGKDQHESGMIHATDAKEYLLSLGLSEDAVAIKTAEQNDLTGADKQDLLEPGCPVRAIITKQALQEGWDCPFAYALCALAVSKSAMALTQLVGRILRQPYAAKTGREPLDRCYVYTHRAQTKDVLDAIKAGLESDGMGDLVGRVIAPGGGSPETVTRYRRESLREHRFYLPEVKVCAGPDVTRDLDWETDILAEVDWLSMPFEADGRGVKKGELTDTSDTQVVDLGILRSAMQGPGATVTISQVRFDREFAVRALSSIVANPWVAAAVVGRFIQGLRSNGWSEEEMAVRQVYLLGELTAAVHRRLDEAAKAIFDAGLLERRIRFHLTTAAWDWEVPLAETISAGRTATSPLRSDGKPFQHSLFEPIYDGEMNSLEFKVACFLDRQEAVWWWYRNVVRGYGLQGWRKNRIYPDFIIAEQRIDGRDRWLVLETKGDQLAGNLDTAYKAALMSRLTEA